MRAFVAIDLPEDIRQSLADLQQQFAQSQADISWVRPDQLHLTLKFLDEVSDSQRAQVEAFLTQLATTTAPITIGLHGVGAFPSSRDPRIIWAGVGKGNAELVALADAIEQESRAVGLKREERAFSAHITLGRLRSARGHQAIATALQTMTWKASAPWLASSLALYQSTLSSQGPTHTLLMTLPFRTETKVGGV